MTREYSRTGSRILGALSMFDNMLLKPQLRVQSGTVQRLSQDSNAENQEPNSGDRSQNGPHTKVGTSLNRPPQFLNSDPGEESYAYGFCKTKDIIQGFKC